MWITPRRAKAFPIIPNIVGHIFDELFGNWGLNNFPFARITIPLSLRVGG